MCGLPTTFVRLTGCPLRCQYCDTAYAFHGGQRQSLEEVLDVVAANCLQHVCVTGGEPLAQPDTPVLLQALVDAGYTVSLETSGAMAVDQVPAEVQRVVDFKTPGSGEVDRNLWTIVDDLTPTDQVKFVLCNRQDYDWANFKCDEHALHQRAGAVLYSTSFGQLEPADLAEWMVADRNTARMQVQMHKVIWGDERGR